MRKVKKINGFSLVEMLIAFAIIVIIFAAIVPQFRAIRNSWTGNEAKAEIIQNGRILAEHITRSLAAAKQIVSFTSSSITFWDNNSIQKRYMLSGGYVVFGAVDSEQQLAGPVSSFQVNCYLIDPCVATTTDCNKIRLVQIDTNFPNNAAVGTKTFTASAYLQTNANTGGGLVGWWKLDEASGTTAADTSGNENDGTVQGTSSPAWGPGRINNALTYTTGVKVYVPSSSTIDFGDEDLSVSLWAIQPTSFSGQYELFIKGTIGSGAFPGSGKRYELYRKDANFRFAIDDDVTKSEISLATTSFCTGNWVHIVAVRDTVANQIRLYADGVLKGTATDSTGSISQTEPLYIADGVFTPGSIDDVRIYNRVLEPNEIAQLAAVSTLEYMGFNEAKAPVDTNTSIAVPIPTGTSSGDLLIAAVAADGNPTISTPAGWTLINQGANGSAVTLGAWRKIAGASESAPNFTWTGGQQAYGWMMRFTGQDVTNPINTSVAADSTSENPTSPAVTTTVANCLILRLGAFDNDDGNTLPEPGYPGLSGHTAITMDESVGSSSNLITNGDFATDITSWTNVAVSGATGTMTSVFDGANGNPAGSALITAINGSTGANNHRFYQVFSVTSGHQYTLSGDWSGNIVGLVTNPTGGSLRNWAEVFVSFETSTTPVNWGGSAIMYKKAYGDGLTNTTTGIWSWEPITSSPNGSYPPAGGIFTATNSYMAVAFNVGGRASSGNPYIRTDNISVIEVGGTSTGTVSGGAGYVKQSAIGSSGTSNFSLTASNAARMITIAIAPASNTSSDNEIRP